MDTRFYKSHLKRHGVLKTVLRGLHQYLGRVFMLKILYCIKLDLQAIDSKSFPAASKFQMARLEPAELIRKDNLEEYQMSAGFLKEMQQKGDICYGVMRNGRLASYCWYSHKPTLLFEGDLELKFSAKCMYVYKVYTHPDFRGRRLVAFGMSNATRELSKQGCDCLVSIVEVDNFSMMKAMVRMGWETTGKFICFKFFKKHHVFSTGRIKDFGFDLHAVKTDIKN